MEPLQPPCDSGTLAITIKGMSGDVLLGPEQRVGADENVRRLKRRLPDRGGTWRLLAEGRELRDVEVMSGICQADAPTEITAVATMSVAVDLAQLAFDAREEARQLELENERWLRDFPTADEGRKREQRDADVRAYKRAVASLLDCLCEDAVRTCRVSARDGKCSAMFDIADLQRYPLGRMFYFSFTRKIREDAILRGWYFSTHGDDVYDPAEVPETMMMGSSPVQGDGGAFKPGPNYFFVRSIAVDLVRMLEEQGLRVAPGYGHGALQLSFGEDDDGSEPARTFEKWWK